MTDETKATEDERAAAERFPHDTENDAARRVFAEGRASLREDMGAWLDRIWHDGKTSMPVGQLRMLDVMLGELRSGDEPRAKPPAPSEPYPLPERWWWDGDVATSRFAWVWADDDGNVIIRGNDNAPAAVVLAVLHRAGLLTKGTR